MKALFDTTTLIHTLKGDQKLKELVSELRKEYVFYTTTVNIYEVNRGIHLLERDKERRITSFAALRNNLIILPIDLFAAEEAAIIYADLQKRGITIDEHDYLIAGGCISNGIDAIITKNEKHFKEIKGLKKIITY